MFRHTLKALAIAGVTGLSSVPLYAQLDTVYDAGDLIFGFQQNGGTRVVQFNLGAAHTYRDFTSDQINIANINSTLSGYSATWYEDDTLYGGAAAANNTGTAAGAPAVNGDRPSTVYYTSQRLEAGVVGFQSSISYNKNQASVTSAATPMVQLGQTFGSSHTNGIAVFTPAGDFGNTWEDFNPIVNPGMGNDPFSGPAFNSQITNGTQDQMGTGWDFGSSYAGISNVAAVWDFYRLARFPSAGVDQLQESTYEGTFVLDQSGNLSFIAAIPEPSSLGLLGIVAAASFMVRRRRKA